MLLAAAIVMRLQEDTLPASMMALAVGANSWASWGFNSIFVHSLGSILVLTTCLLLIIRLSKVENRIGLSLCILAVTAGAWSVDYTSLAWIGAALMTVVVLDLSKSKEFTHLSSRGSAAILAVIAGLLGMTKDTIVSALSLSIFASSEKSASNSFTYASQESTLSFSKIYYYTIALALAVYGVLKIYQTAKSRIIILSGREQILGVLSFASGAVILLYLLMGRFQQFFIFLIGPILGLIVVDTIGKERLAGQFSTVFQKHGVTAFLLILAIAATAGFAAAPSNLSPASEANAERTGYWITEYRDDTTVLTDLTTQARLRMGAHHAGDIETIEPISYDPERYGSLVSGGDVGSQAVVVDYVAKNGVGAPGWKRFENLSGYRANITANKNINSVHTDGQVTTYIVK
ncbi:hypothetical protein [Halosimplex salinum]|uniref:hypothetical protein n=1 Tax=Halosimplex salinum TaxID=1710538 RepID=UPI0013DE5C46|nr:hypothetical protein [Halosimplex salinum]